MTCRRQEGPSTGLSLTRPFKCPACGRFPESFILSGLWLEELAQLIARHPEQGICIDLPEHSDIELWGILQFLRRLDESKATRKSARPKLKIVASHSPPRHSDDV